MSQYVHINCGSTEGLENLLKLLVRSTTCSEWVDCENTQDSIESIIKRLVSETEDGTLALNVCCDGDVILDSLTVNSLSYADTYWDDLQISQGMFEFAGVSDPTLVNYDVGGSGLVMKLYEFAKNDEAYFKIQVPHKTKEGSRLRLHMHWTPGARGVTENGNLVGWKADFLVANVNEAFPATFHSADLQDACDGINHQHQITQSVEFDIPDLRLSAFIIGKIYRSDTGADDTWSGAVPGQLPLFLGVDFHYEIDSPGSREEYIK